MRGISLSRKPHLHLREILTLTRSHKKISIQRAVLPLIAALSISLSYPALSMANVNSPQGALDIAGIVPGRYVFAEKRQDIIDAAGNTISSVRGIAELMNQARELNALLASSGAQGAQKNASVRQSADALDLALKVSAIVPDFPVIIAPGKAKAPAKPGKTSNSRQGNLAPSQPINNLLASKNLSWPADGAIYSAFRATRGKRIHGAIDIVNKKGTPIAAAADGVVSVAANGGKKYSGYGKIVIIDHGNGVHTVYAHCDSLLVKMGQRVKKGEFIGTVGRTGRATTDHVHFEVRLAGKKVDPLEYLPSRPEMVKAINWHSAKSAKSKKN